METELKSHSFQHQTLGSYGRVTEEQLHGPCQLLDSQLFSCKP